MKITIGIISYLPDNLKIRECRLNKLRILLNRCEALFHLPIMIIEQNWKNTSFKNAMITEYRYDDKLGITGARKELRKRFLESDFDYLIMLDDDCEIIGDSGYSYLKQIYENPNCFIEFNKTLLKLFAISKEILKEQDFPEINPEKEEGFEDRIFVNTLRAKFPDQRRCFEKTGLFERSISTKDPNSTWYTNQNLKQMVEKTIKLIEKL